MKRMLSLVLALTMVLVMSSPVLALETPGVISTATGITEFTDAQQRTIRTFDVASAEFKTAAPAVRNQQVKQVLREMGMDAEAAEKLTPAKLDKISNAEAIQSVSSYIKVDENRNVTYISEAQALQEVAALKAKQAATRASNPDEEDDYEDSYMYLWHGLIDEGNAKFTLMTEATWLTMPRYRGTDVIGSSGQEMAIDPDSMEGYYNYESIINSTDSSTSRDYTISENDFDVVSNGTFSGTGASIDLPKDVYIGSGASILYTGYFVHVEHVAYLRDPDNSTNFNTTGSYVHNWSNTYFSPSISISANGVSGSLSINSEDETEVRSVVLLYYYDA